MPYRLKNCISIFFFFFLKSFVLKTLLIVSGFRQNCQNYGSSLKKKVFSLPKLAEVVKNRGSKILTSKISAVAPISAYKPLFLGEIECFLPFLRFWDPKNFFSKSCVTNIGEPRRTSKQRFVNWYF